MWVYENETAVSAFVVDLTKDREVQDNLPCNFLSVRNDSSLIAHVYLNSKKVGSIQAYSADSFIGKNFEVIMIKQPDKDNFGIKELFLQVGKNEQMSSMPYNPSWDLIEENIDVYASGCDTRFSCPNKITLSDLKYWINAYNNLIVQRRLDVTGTASLGTYAITYSSDTVISGGTPINGIVLDTKQYKKTINNSEFNYSLTNCSITGLMIDYKKPDDYTIGCTVTSSNLTYPAHTDPNECYDDNLTTWAGPHFKSTSYVSTLEIAFDETDVNAVSFYGGLYYAGSVVTTMKTELKVNSTWISVDERNAGGGSGMIAVNFHLNTGWSKVTGLRLSVKGNNATYNCDAQYKDITII